MEVSTGVLGTGLLLIGITLLVVEAHVPGWGGPGALGVVSVVAGVLMVLDAGSILELPRLVIIALCVLAAIFVPVATILVMRSRKVPTVRAATLIGIEGVAVSDLNPLGVVLVRSEQHSAEAQTPPIEAGARVRVVEEKGLKLWVARA